MSIGKVIDEFKDSVAADKAIQRDMPSDMASQFESIQFQATGQQARFQDQITDPNAFMFTHIIRMDEDLPRWWSRARDIFLRNYSRESGLLAGAVFGESTRVKNLSWIIETQDKTADDGRLDHFQKVFELAQFGAGMPAFLHKVTNQLLTQDNGAFIEIMPENPVNEYFEGTPPTYDIGPNGQQVPKDAGTPSGWLCMPLDGRVGGIACFDSAQCWRTYDPEWPVIYVNRWTGQWRILHWSRVATLSSHTQPDELGRGIGLCAISRTFVYARLIQYMDTYFKEKVAGQAADFGTMSGLTASQLKAALESGQIAQDNKGLIIYKNIRFISGASPEIIPQVELHSIKGLPDGFDHEKEMRLAATAMSVGFGVSSNGLGLNFNVGRTKAEADAQERETAGKGRIDIENMICNVINQRILPDGDEFRFDEKDDQADKQREEIKQIRVSTRKMQIESGEITAEEARIIAAEEGDIPPEYAEIPIVGDNEAVEDDNPVPGAMDQNEDLEMNENEGGETPEDTKKALATKRMEIRESAFYQTLTPLLDVPDHSIQAD